ncbi:MAG: hypothetical protein IJW40_10000 [Clostridia bacterium]|nr:hypothetical protein [Clostridia bacterium]
MNKIKKIHGVIVITFSVINVFLANYNDFFADAAACFFVSGIAMIETVNALKPMKNFGPINTIKRYYQNRDKLDIYKKNMYVLSFILLLAGGLNFVRGLCEIIINLLSRFAES